MLRLVNHCVKRAISIGVDKGQVRIKIRDFLNQLLRLEILDQSGQYMIVTYLIFDKQ